MSARQAIPGLVRRIVLDGDWQAAPLILADALEEIGECRAARLLRTRQKRLANQIAKYDNYIEFTGNIIGRRRPLTVDEICHRPIEVFRLYVARRLWRRCGT